MEIIFWILVGAFGWSYIKKKFSKKHSSDSYSSTISETKKETKKTQTKPTTKSKLNEEKIFIENIKLNEEQEALFNQIENTNDNIFVTGKAGTGKSVLLQYLKHKSKKKIVIGAYTGVAALNVGGQTLNSLFQLPIGFIELEQLNLNKDVATLMRHIDTLVIDEISMVRADMMEAIDFLFRKAKKNQLPFGGVQVVAFGDPYQLPPIVKDEDLHQYFSHNYGGPYFFNSTAWQRAYFNTFELEHIFRQEGDDDFKSILNAVRENKAEKPILDNLNQRCVDSIPHEDVITLATRNAVVSRINNNRLDKLKGKLYIYQADISGNLEKSAFPTDEFLKIKKGAQVMLLKNDPEKRWVNGTVGIVKSLSQNHVQVCIDGKFTYYIPKVTWNKVKYFYNEETNKIEEEVVSSFTQYPLKLAWALTIHKSQGKTYNSVIVNMEGGAFAHGQTYVALSRCTSLQSLYLTQPIQHDDIKVDPLVVDFMENTVKKSKIDKKNTKAKSYGVIPIFKSKKDVSILLVKNSVGGHWGFPKGTPDKGEPPLETAKRELLEETGIKNIKIKEKPTFRESYSFEHEGKTYDKTNKYWLGFVDKMSTGKELDQIDEVKWVKIDKAKDILVHDSAIKMVGRIKKYLNK